MLTEKAFALNEIHEARDIVRAHPFATLVTAGLHATHMPCLLDEEADALTIVGHVARADPVSEHLDGPLLAIFTGPHGYISASWYGSDMIPTWNYVTLHMRGDPVVLEDPLPVLRQTVDRFEAAVDAPWSLDRAGGSAREMADRVRAFRLQAHWWHAEAKLSQDKSEDEQARVLAGLEHDRAYRNPALAEAMRSRSD
jgi:transcriptional regulator